MNAGLASEMTMSDVFSEEVFHLFGLLLRQNFERQLADLENCNQGRHHMNKQLYEPKFCLQSGLLSYVKFHHMLKELCY